MSLSAGWLRSSKCESAICKRPISQPHARRSGRRRARWEGREKSQRACRCRSAPPPHPFARAAARLVRPRPLVNTLSLPPSSPPKDVVALRPRPPCLAPPVPPSRASRPRARTSPIGQRHAELTLPAAASFPSTALSRPRRRPPACPPPTSSQPLQPVLARSLQTAADASTPATKVPEDPNETVRISAAARRFL